MAANNVTKEALAAAEQLITIFTDKFFAELVLAIKDANDTENAAQRDQLLALIKGSIATMVQRDLGTAVATYQKLLEVRQPIE